VVHHKSFVILLLLFSKLAFAESVRLAWDAPAGNPQPIPSSYGVFVYKCCQACSSTDCATGSWCEAPLENTNSTQTTYVVTRPAGQYMFMVGYYINGVFQAARSNSLCYTIKPGEVAAPPPPTTVKSPANLRFP